MDKYFSFSCIVFTLVMQGKFDRLHSFWHTYEEKLSEMSINYINGVVSHYPKTSLAWKILLNDPFVKSQWEMADYLVVGKMGYNAHGDTHALVVAANALRILSILIRREVLPDIAKDGLGDIDDGFLIVLVSSLLHDIGNQVNRRDHNLHGGYLALPIIDKLLERIYDDPFKRGVVRAFILHSIFTHMEDERSYTVEASVVKLADGTDMSKGRSRLPYSLGNVNIHSVSAMSVDGVEIVEGEDFPIEIRVFMTNSSGVFQVEEILQRKLSAGVLEDKVKIVAKTIPEDVDKDERLVYRLIGKFGRFIHER